MTNNVVPIWVNRGEATSLISIRAAQKYYSAIYVGDFCIKDRRGNWSESPVSVFFVETPSKPEYSQYLGLFVSDQQVMITDALSVTDEPFTGIVADDGEIVYSRFRHDFRTSTDGSVTIDGGRDYVKLMGNLLNPVVKLTIVRENIVVNDSIILPCVKPEP